MNATKEKQNWEEILEKFSTTNSGRPTRLGVFEDHDGTVDDYWLEAGLPLSGITLEKTSRFPTVIINLGKNFAHPVKNTRCIKVIYNFDDNSDGLDITDELGRTNVLRFENREI